MKLPAFRFKKSGNTAAPKAASPEKNMRIIKMLLAIILVLLLLTLFMVMQLQSMLGHTLNQESKQLHTLQQGESQILHTLATQQKTTHAQLSTLSATLHTTTTAQKQQQQAFQQYQAQTKQQLAHVTQSMDQAVKTIQTLAAQAHTPASSSAQQATPNDPPKATNQYKPAPGYHLYGVEPYGVVIVDLKGKFIITRVGRDIPGLGQVKAITADQVMVGDYVITPK